MKKISENSLSNLRGVKNKGKNKLLKLLEYKSVFLFYRSFRTLSNSSGTTQVYLSAIKVFCDFLGRDPNSVITYLKRRDVTNVVQDFLDHLTKKGMAPKTIEAYFSAVKGFLEINGINVRSIKTIRKPRVYVRAIDRAPTKEEIRAAISVSDEESKALIAFLATTGCRLGEALAILKNDVDFSVEPARVRIRPEIAKDRIGRMVFLTKSTGEILKNYMEKHDSSLVFPLTRFKAYRKIMQAFRKIVKVNKIGGRNELHPHSLRKFFFTTSLKILGRELTEALIGHKQYLDSAYRRLTEEELANEFKKLEEELEDALVGTKTSTKRQIVVPVEQVEKYISEGYEFKALIPNGKAIMSKS
ncbi:MAG: site-specific integrase [Thermoproteota archaeon]